MNLMHSLSLALVLLLSPALAQAQQFFDFDGQATGYTQVGDTIDMYSIVLDPPSVDTPLPLDFANFQYTIVVTGLQVDLISGNDTGFIGGTIALYEDDTTPADYADPSSFTDGTALLSGELENLVVQMFTADLGSGSGVVSWTGGSNINDLRPQDRLNWAFLINVSAATEAGYDARWDGKVEPQEPVVDNDVRSWGAVKTEF